jgi:hypothetical protein
MLACALETEDCPAICRENPSEPGTPDPTAPKSGDLEVAVADYSSTMKTAPREGTVVFNKISFKTSEAVTVNSIVLERAGLSSRSDINGVWFEKDGKAVSSVGKVASDGRVTVNFTRGFTVKANETLDLVAELKGPIAGSQIAFKLIDAESTARSVNIKGETTTFQTVNYTVATAKFEATSDPSDPKVEYKLGTQNVYTFGEFKLENIWDSTGKEDKTIIVRNITLNNASTDLQGLLKNVQVVRDGKVVSKYVTLEGRDMVIAFDNETIDGGRTATYTIRGEIDVLERVPSTVNLQLKKSADLVAEEQRTNFRTTVAIVTNKDVLTAYEIQGGKIRFVNDDSFANSVDAGLGSSAVVVARGNLEVAEPTLLKNLIIKPTAGSGMIKNLAIEVGGSRYGLDYQSNNDQWTIDEISVSRNASVRILVDMLSVNPNKIPAIVIGNITASSFTASGEFLNNGESFAPSTAVAGVIKGATLNIKTPTFSLEETSNLTTQKVVKGDANTRVMFEGTLVSKKGDVTGRSITISGVNNTLTGGAKLSLNVYIDGVAQNCGTEVLGNSFTTCKVTQGIGTIGSTAKKIKVEAYLDATDVNAAGSISFEIFADGRLDGNDTESNHASTIDLSVSDSSSITVSNAGSANTIALAGSNRTLAKFDVNVANGYVNLTGLTLTGSFTGSQYRLFIDEEDTSANVAISLTDVEFTGFNFYAKEGKHTVEIKATIPNRALTGVEVKVDSFDIQGTATKTGSLSLQYYFVRVIPTITVKSRNTDMNELVLNVYNSYDTTFEIAAISGTNVAGASIGGNKVTIANTGVSAGSTALAPVTVAKGDTVEIKLSVDAGKTLTLDGLTYTVDEDGGPYTYGISDTYADPIKWGDFRISGK